MRNLFISPINTLEPLQWIRLSILFIDVIAIVRLFFNHQSTFTLITGSLIFALYSGFCAWQFKSEKSSKQLPLLIIDTTHIHVMCGLNGLVGQAFSALALAFVALAAINLSREKSILLAGISSILYGLVTAFSLADGQHSIHTHEITSNAILQMHLWGMVTTYTFAALLITIACGQLTKALITREHIIRQLREQQLRDEHLIALGTQSVSLTHELATPLNSMALLITELSDKTQPTQTRQTVSQLKDIISHCNQQLRKSLNQRIYDTNPATIESQLNHYCDTLIQQWQITRPEIHTQTPSALKFRTDLLALPEGLKPVLLNLLNNAADASLSHGRHFVGFDAQRIDDQLVFVIQDQGAGLTDSQKQKLGQCINSEKQHGHGLGLAISHASLERWGATLTLVPRDVGTTTQVMLPLIDTPRQAS